MDPITRACEDVALEQQRRLKAQKIEALLGGALRDGADLLDIGTGSGWIAHHFARHPTLRLRVSAVDAHDLRRVREGYAFTAVTGTALPFADASFDVVFSNHVIEHVGSQDDQRHHLSEIRRVLRPQGVAYLAVPNRWSLIEPHYRLAFLSWLPAGIASAYLRLSRRGTRYEWRPLGPWASRQLFRQAGLSWADVSAKALVTVLQLEHSTARAAAVLARWIERFAANWFGWLSPTLVYTLKRKA